MIRFNCPDCGASIKAPDDTVGKQGSCPKCGRSVPVPQEPLPHTTAKVIEASAFVLKDDNRKTRAELKMSEIGEPMLTLYDKDDNCRVKLTIDERGDTVHFLYGEEFLRKAYLSSRCATLMENHA